MVDDALVRGAGRYRLAIFDFDGTLADSFPFFVSVFNDLARKHGFNEITPASVPALRDLGAAQVMAQVGLPLWRLPMVARDFKALMRARIGEIQAFEGVDVLLSHLQNRGCALAVVSSNASDNVRCVLGPRNCGAIAQFECGASIFGKTARLRRVLRRLGKDARDAIFIGDQLSDLQAAHAAGMAFGAVSWGYGTLASFSAHRTDEVFAAPADIARLFP